MFFRDPSFEFKDAEGVLTPAQLAQLKAWFAVGLNPQINELLYSFTSGPDLAPLCVFISGEC